MRHYGIIGNPVEQSFSARYFTEKFAREGIDAEYSRYRCETVEEARHLLDTLDGFNVTIPHKQAIIPLLDRLDDTAATIGAVNVVKRSPYPAAEAAPFPHGLGREYYYTGYNTDCIGFMDSIRPMLCEGDRKALVLGTGGAAKAVHYGLRQLGLAPTYVSRTPAKGQLGYSDLTSEVMDTHTVIVNCTPLGMWPATDACPAIPYDLLTEAHLLFDCVYNPEETLFLRKGKQHGARTQSGMGMLYGQAIATWRIWNFGFLLASC